MPYMRKLLIYVDKKSPTEKTLTLIAFENFRTLISVNKQDDSKFRIIFKPTINN